MADGNPEDAYGMFNEMRAVNYAPNMMMTAIQQPPQPFENPLGNMAFQMLVPQLMAMLTGQGVQFMPQMQPGMTPFTALYSHNYTTPAYQQLQMMQMQQSGASWGGFFGDVGNRMGINNLFGYDPSTFRNMAVNAGGTSMGGMMSMFADMMFSDVLRGGSMAGSLNQIYANSGLLTTPRGGMVETLVRDPDTGAFTQMINTDAIGRRAAYSQELYQGLYDRIYKRPDPTTGEMKEYITADLDYTQGFDVGDISGRLTGYLAQRGQLRGMDKDAAIKTIGEWAETLNSLSEVMGSRDMGQLLGAVSMLTQGPLTTAKGAALKEQMVGMQATAISLGVGVPEYFQAAIGMAQNLTSMAGIAAGGNPNTLRSRSGRSLTNAGALAMGANMATTVYSIGMMQGDVSPGALMDITAEQQALAGLWMNSPQGRDTLQIEWLNEQGALDPADYTRWRSAIENGSIAEAEQLGKDILGAQFGSWQEARKLMRDPRYATQIWNQVSEDGFENYMDLGAIAQERELIERRGQQRERRMRGQISGAAKEFGVSLRDISGRGAAQFSAMKDYMLGAGADAGLIDEMQSIYDAAGGGDRGAGAVRRAMRGEEYNAYRTGAFTAGTTAEAERVLEHLRGMPPAEPGSAEEMNRQRRIQALESQISTSKLVQDVDATLADTTSSAGRQDAYLSEIDRRQSEGLITEQEANRMRGQLGLTELYTAGRMGVHGVVRAIEQRRDARQRIDDINAQAQALVPVVQEAGGKVLKGTFYERMAKWVQGEGNVFDVLGLVTPEGAGDLPSMETFMKMEDAELRKLAGGDEKVYKALKKGQSTFNEGPIAAFAKDVGEIKEKQKLRDDKFRWGTARAQAYEKVLGKSMTAEQRVLLGAARAKMNEFGAEAAETHFRELATTMSTEQLTQVRQSATEIDSKIAKEVGADKGKKKEEPKKPEIIMKGTLTINKDGTADIEAIGTSN